MKRKWHSRVLARGVVVDRTRGYVYVRYRLGGRLRKELLGRTSEPDVIDRANYRAQQIRHLRRFGGQEFEIRKQRMLVEDAADVFQRLHGAKRPSHQCVSLFARYVRRIKQAWSGRFVDGIVGDDMRDYRAWRKSEGAADSTINREQTAIITMFNKLVEWRRGGLIPRNVILPETNPGNGVKKVNEDRFIRSRLMSDEEFRSLWTAADNRLRRILLAVMNLPLRLADLKKLKKSDINYKLSQFRGVQAKTNREFVLPINRPMWDVIRRSKGDLILDFTGFDKRWKKARAAAGLTGSGGQAPLQFRDLRRTAATALHDCGVPLRTISAMLGHHSVTTTIRYLGLREENLVHAGDVLAARYADVSADSRPHQSVPKSVPTESEDREEEVDDSCLNDEQLRGCGSMVECELPNLNSNRSEPDRK